VIWLAWRFWVLVTGETYSQRALRLNALRRIYAEMSEAERKVMTEHRRLWN